MSVLKTVLIVEDDTITAMMLQRSLTVMGYRILEPVSSGLDAIRAVETEHPDIIFMDIRIAGDLDGIRTAEIIRERFDIPIAFMTGYFSDDTTDLTRNLKPVGIISKPLEIEQLKELIEAVPKRSEV